MGQVSIVAVGTTIADRPPRRSVRARLRIRLLPRMGSGKASTRVGMQNAWAWNPPGQEWVETIPAHLCALAASDQYALPEPANAATKDAQLTRVTRNGVVSVVAQHNLAEPRTDLGRTMMLAALKLSLDGLKLRHHSLLRRDPPDGESSSGLALPTEVGEAQEREGLWFSRSALLSIRLGRQTSCRQRCAHNLALS
jgi:hypothetical protein